MAWTVDKMDKLKRLWGKGNTASQIAQIIGDVTRNAVIGKANRLNLSNKILPKSSISASNVFCKEKSTGAPKRGRKIKFKSLIIEKDFEPENPIQLEELNDNTCKWPTGHPNESNFYFCGRKSLKYFSYCKLHLLYAYQPKVKKEDVISKEDDIPQFIEKKIKSA
jgi:GcrA cell cycle regulator|tara:strand:- start:237 stop:731 length:495 start_codon:yes stop_codon:yes gene_type:complete